ncbi:MAG TPA: formate dehydrogenase, partial [Aestuariivirga sp.]|nr:formate dehydrogenase [Aestuariivirga sp.]
MIRIYVPRDSAARAVGADEVADSIAAEAVAQKISIQIIRNGSRGMMWLEPLVEIETPKGRVAY